MDSFASAFARVDQAGDSRSCVSCLDFISSLPFFQECKNRSFQELRVRPGVRVLEVGCGNGTDLGVLAGIVGREGQVTGIDASLTMLATARDRNTGRNANVPEFVRCDAAGLPFPDHTFDAVRADRVLQHTGSPPGVVLEMARVTRPSGRVVVFEPDWETLVLWPGDREVTRGILNFWCDRFPSGWAGRSLYASFKAAGLAEVTVVPLNLVLTDLSLAGRLYDLPTTLRLAVGAGIVSSGQAEDWTWEQAQADAAGQFFSSMTFYLVSGTRPG
jgi:ubiquinone/menaquinone biosynthesis C-methylase UbiE